MRRAASASPQSLERAPLATKSTVKRMLQRAVLSLCAQEDPRERLALDVARQLFRSTGVRLEDETELVAELLMPFEITEEFLAAAIFRSGARWASIEAIDREAAFSQRCQRCQISRGDSFPPSLPPRRRAAAAADFQLLGL